jgi:ribonuclease BN (tRNA processing enzyme)
MDVRVLPSASGGGKGQPLSTYLINGRLAVDAGAVGLFGPPSAQAAVADVVLTHSHLDHVAGLPILVDNVYEPAPGCVQVYGSRETLDCLRRDVFNNRLYPDMIGLSERLPPFLQLHELTAHRPVRLGDLTVTPVPVDHVVPCFGFIVEDPTAAIAIATDTRPTDELWTLARRNPKLAAVFLEASFPVAEAELAGISGHMTTAQFAAELDKLPPDVPVYPIHIKPRFYAEIVKELQALKLKRLVFPRAGATYQFKKRPRAKSA